MLMLRLVLLLDAGVLLVLGAGLTAAPGALAAAAGFAALSPAMQFVVGLWGCALVTLGLGYVLAAQDPVRNVSWVQTGIVRGALECLLGVTYLARGEVSFRQAGLGTIIAGLIALAYVVFYPRDEAPAADATPAS